MVHAYKCLDRFFLLDVESGSVFEVDELVYLLIKKRISPLDVSEGDFSRFCAEDIRCAEDEIEQLISVKILFSPPQSFHRPASSGIIKAMCLNITHDCNLRCAYCFADGGSYRGERTHMSADIAKAAVDFLIRSSGKRKNLEIDFFGGEPVLNFSVITETVAYAKKQGAEYGKNFRFTVTTNALLLNDDHVDFFNKEMYNVVLSIDGREEVHNFHRKTQGGKDSFDNVVKNALRFKKERKGQYYIRGTFTSHNIDFANDVLSLSDAGFEQLSIEPVVLGDDDELAVKEQHLPAVFAEYERLAAQYLERRKGDKWFNFFHFFIDLDGGLCLSKRLKGCGAGGEYVAVSVDGSIYPCHQFDGDEKYKMGNVMVGDVDSRVSALFTDSCVLDKSACAECWAKYYCSGGCAAANIKYAGGINNVCELTCQIVRKRLECAIAVKAIENK